MNDEPNKAKAEIRARMRALLTAMDEKQRHAASSSACSKLASLEAFDHAGVVMLYMPMANEIDVTPAAVKCFRLGKTVCVPRVDWHRGEMDPVEVTSLDDHVLDCDEHGVRVPKICRPILPKLIELVVVPGLAYDAQGNRLGRGGGYYDRFLGRLRPSATTVGLIFDQQIVPKVPTKKHDVAVDIVVTDRRVTMAKSERTKA
ncbi:MAG: 5-formyltetrahydrofolate cyclo-ligase [Phycisphaerales bacterium]|nr:5-formyltetrahydrofolate cyclo-ligase [Phycisphaerales bacterium]MCI0631200.1 5-formyltetrahydrofolate cyclo-ligase [Phycisphaerales bacterium]MCI0675475.1 5-formyltetrahydrofolate cyclo-ligase [Phycisphaerales bacterium]